MNNINHIKYCKKCIIPETRPHTEIGEDGICSGCKYFDQRKNIDWDKRKSELIKVFNKYKNKGNNNYDCIIPSSGGKDRAIWGSIQHGVYLNH